MLNFEESVRRRILQNRKNIDPARLAAAVELFKDYPRTKGSLSAVSWYGQHGLQAQQIKANRERRDRNKVYVEYCQRRHLENCRITQYRTLLHFRQFPFDVEIFPVIESVIKDIETTIKKKYGFLDPLPAPLVKKIERLQRQKEEEQQKNERLLSDPMEQLLQDYDH